MTRPYNGNSIRVNQTMPAPEAGQGALFEAIRQVSFVMDELRLYLDTHPDDREALASFLGEQERRHALLDEYTEKYVPIEAYRINNDGTWSWVNSPMPWKAEAN